MDNDLSQRLDALEAKINAIHESVEKTRKYFLWTLIITVVVIVLPLIGMVFAVPALIGTYTSMLNGL